MNNRKKRKTGIRIFGAVLLTLILALVFSLLTTIDPNWLPELIARWDEITVFDDIKKMIP